MILNCGEALIDMLPRTSTGGEEAFAPYPGGAVFNTAIALGRLGAPSAFYCALAGDMFGEMLQEALKDSRVSTDYAPVVDRPSTLAFVKLTDGQASYAFYDEGTALRMMTPDALPELDDAVSALFFGGISLVGEPCGSAFEALATREAGRRTIMIDPNIRTSFITDEDAYRGRVDRMLALADIVKVSDEDLRWIMGDGDLSELAGKVLQMGPRAVCLTEGDKGARAFTNAAEVQVAASRVEVADTVGAGDTFNAGVLAALHRAGMLDKTALDTLTEDHLRGALSLGVRAAAVTVSRKGANPPWDREL